jgi:hypothetical protein
MDTVHRLLLWLSLLTNRRDRRPQRRQAGNLSSLVSRPLTADLAAPGHRLTVLCFARYYPSAAIALRNPTPAA